MMDSEPTTEMTIYDEFGHWIIVDVCEPVTITAKEGFARSESFTSYLIRLETNHYGFARPYTAVRRRYSEFCWLRAMLQRHHPNITLPSLPPKKYLHLVRFNPRIIEIRRSGLAKFLEQLLASSMLIRDPVLHLFLQTDLSIREMEEKLNERLPFSVESSGSDVGLNERYRAMPRPNTVTASISHDSTGVSSASNHISNNPAFVRSYSIASSGSESAGTTSGDEQSINSSAATNQSSVAYLRNSRLMPETVSQLLMFQCP
ncbi:unnamed protein product [Orchesella dallaii]|uniref:PX domain-containing protein n=1 Tax=Orchesella dallaii TaxID=48710 RepID=A0ABP1QN42_9HEXA